MVGFTLKFKIKSGENYRIFLPLGENILSLTPVTESFSIGFKEGNYLTFFVPEEKLVQIEFMTVIPWVIDSSLETE